MTLLRPSRPTLKRPALRHARTALLAGFGLLLMGCAQFTAADSRSPGSVVLIAAAEGEIASDALPQGGSAYGSYLAGLYAGQQRDLSAAADFMLEALADDPNDEQLLNRAFLLTASDGRLETAANLAKRLLAIDPKQSLAALVETVDAIHRGAFKDAESLLVGLPDRGLTTVTGPLLLAWIHSAEGDLPGALKAIQALGEKDGFGVLYNLHVGLLNDLAGEKAAARAAYEKALETAGQPSMRLVWLVGNFYERSGDVAAAKKLFTDFQANNPDSYAIGWELDRLERGGAPTPSIASASDGAAEALFNMASLLSQERAEEVALIHAHLALLLRPGFEVAQILVGEILQGQGRGEAAIEIYRKIKKDSPFGWPVQLRIAEELERLGRVDDAVAQLESMADQTPDRFEALFRLGNLLRGQERFAEAVKAYDRAAERIPGDERRFWTFYYFRGIALERTGDWDRAQADFLHALDLEPEQPLVMNYLAYSWVEKHMNLDRAKKMLVRAVELRPDDGYIVDSLGWVYYRLGEYDKGVTYLERAVELRPQDSVINDHLGDAYWRVGRRQEARFQWHRALSLGPDDDQAVKIKKKIDHGLGEPTENI